jgi:hypothetical protein
MHQPDELMRDSTVHLRAERLKARILDAELEALGLPPSAVAAFAPAALTTTARQTVAEVVLGAVERAGLMDPFRTCTVNDAIDANDAGLCALLGAVLVRTPHDPDGPSRQWAPPPGMPRTANTEALLRELAGRLVRSEVTRAEGRTRGPR